MCVDRQESVALAEHLREAGLRVAAPPAEPGRWLAEPGRLRGPRLLAGERPRRAAVPSISTPLCQSVLMPRKCESYSEGGRKELLAPPGTKAITSS